jgi:hypothetical protein
VRWIVVLALVGCQQQPRTATRRTIDTGDATHCAIGDFDGDGKREIALGGPSDVRIVTVDGTSIATMPVDNGLSQLVAADLDGDRRDELYAAWGWTREHRDGNARVTKHEVADGKIIGAPVLEPETTRQEIAAIVPAGDSLLVAYYSSKYMVTSVMVKPGAPPTPLAELRMAAAYAYGDINGDKKPEVVVGRTYGDDIGVDGDAFVLSTHAMIPTTRGVRAIAIINGDVILADGWHHEYANRAKSLVTLAHFAAASFTTEQIDDVAGQYAVEAIVPVKLREPAFVTRGTHQVRVYRSGKPTKLAGAARDIAVGDLNGDSFDEILILAEPSEIVSIQ